MVRYTVLGSSGFVGQRLSKALCQLGRKVWSPLRGEEMLFRKDLGRVFYCIGLTADYARNPFETVEAHTCFLARILREACFERLVYLSSTRLYDSSTGTTAREDQPLSIQPANPRHIYDLSKALGENLCLNASDGRARVARLSCVFDAAPGSPGFLSEWLQRARRERAFELDSSSGFVRDYVALDDVVRALIAVLDHGESDIYNVAGGENISNRALADIFNECGWQVTLCRQTPMQEAPVSDISRLRALKITPTPVREVVRTFLQGLSRTGEI